MLVCKNAGKGMVVIMNNRIGLYIHIPYCKSKCAYCDFYSMPGREDFDRYADALVLHMEDYSDLLKDREISSIYIGGGTPTVMPYKSMCTVIDGIYENFKVADKAEFTIECNPATASASDFKKYRRAGANRLSIGIQSACGRELKALTRIHSYEEAEDCFYAARKAGFDNINIDLMYGIPYQTRESLEDTMERICELDPEHISLYGLKIEEETPFFKLREKLALPGEDEEANMYFSSVEYLRRNGYDQYEISNFAKEGFACRHNIKYWSCGEYLGLGPGAHSYLGGCRFSFKRDIDRYIESMERPDRDYDIIDEKYNISPNDRIGEYVMLHLRTVYGVDTSDFEACFGKSFENMYSAYLNKYIEGGYMKKNGNRYYFTPGGMYVSNYILSDMLDFDGELASSGADGKTQ